MVESFDSKGYCTCAAPEALHASMIIEGENVDRSVTRRWRA